MITLTINKKPVSVEDGTTVAAAILNSGSGPFRLSVTGGPRGALCGMGICFECRVTIDGIEHRRSCTVLAETGMEIETGE